MLKNTLIYLIDTILKILTILGLLSIILAYLSSKISPEIASWVQLFGLATPVIAIVNLIILIYWLIRLKPFLIVAILAFLIGISPTNKLYKLNFSKSENTSSSGIRVLSYNVMGFYDSKFTNKGVEVLKRIETYRPDIVCFQEFSTVGETSLATVNAHLYQQRYRRVYFNKKFTSTSGLGMAVYSRYRILDGSKIELGEGESQNGAMWVDIRIDKDTIRVFNLHLESTTVNNTERVLLSDKSLVTHLDNSKLSQLKAVANKISKSSVQRAKQVEIIRSEIDKSPYPTIVCGDFNDTANSYVYNKIRGNMRDAFLEAGRGYGYTFKDFFSMLRIDYILASQDFEVERYELKDFHHSDHYPIEARLLLNK